MFPINLGNSIDLGFYGTSFTVVASVLLKSDAPFNKHYPIFGAQIAWQGWQWQIHPLDGVWVQSQTFDYAFDSYNAHTRVHKRTNTHIYGMSLCFDIQLHSLQLTNGKLDFSFYGPEYTCTADEGIPRDKWVRVATWGTSMNTDWPSTSASHPLDSWY